jgi:arylsulfatase A-like enzyme
MMKKKNKGGPIRSSHILLLVTAFAALMVFFSCRSPRLAGPASDKVILITLDTTRADRLACYGYKNVETPHLDRIASEGVLFENALCQAPMTLPSHATMMTGLYPPNHGVRNNTGYVLREGMTTVAEILKEKGYKTGAAISAFVITSQFGIAQGFDSYDEDLEIPQVKIKWLERDAKRTIDAAMKWFETYKDEEKIFFWLHLYDPHAFYSPPEPFYSQYKGHLYDGEIAYTDWELGRFFQYLKSIEIYDEAFFVIAGDHGEGLGDHRENTHELLIYESTMKIPLIIKSNSIAGNQRVHATVSTTDIFPTIMQACHIKDFGKVDGASLFPLLKTPESDWEEEYYMESMAGNIVYGWSQLKGIRKGAWKYMDCPSPELYDLEKDPEEKENLFLVERDVAEQMQESLQTFEAGWPDEAFQKSAVKNLDQESIDKLMSLGYIGSPSAITDSSSKDPKDFVEIHDKIDRVALLFLAKKVEQGVKALSELLPLDRENKMILFYLGMAHHDLGKNDEAIDYLETLVALHPDHLQGYKRLADLYLDEEKWEELKDTIERALEFFPEEAEFHYKFALTFLYEQKVSDALSHLKEAIRLVPDHGAYYLLSSKCYLALGEKEKAIGEIEQAASVGFKNFSILFKDPAFLDIIDDPSLQKILQNNY